MNRSPTLGHLDPEDWKRLEEIADRFEKAWQQAPEADSVDISTFLPAADDALRPLVLHELIKIDLEARCKRGGSAPLEEYLQKFPELGPADTLSPQLIYEEYRVRQLYGDKPSIDSYRSRFPAQHEELAQLLQDQPLPTLTHGNQTPASPKPSPPSLGPAASSQLISGGGQYQLIKRLGTGGFGEVWLAETAAGVPVAIKIIFRPIDHEEAQRERKSLELIKRLRHIHLLWTIDFFVQDGRLHIVMELADGSLRDRLKECRQPGLLGIPPAELLDYFREAAEALDYLHNQHVIHRDIKPENILLLQRHAKVADFGLARFQEAERSIEASGSGTPAYMAPEVWRGKASPRSDQYGLAVAYVEMRLDRRPFASGDMMDVMFGHLEHKPDLNGLPEAEQQVLLKALSKDPSRRYSSCREFVRALEQALAPQLGGTFPHQSDTAQAQGAGTGAPPSGAATDLETLAGPAEWPPAVPQQPFASATDLQGPSAPPVKPQKDWRDTAVEPVLPPGQAKQRRKPRVAALTVLAMLVLTIAGGLIAVIRRPNQHSPDGLPAGTFGIELEKPEFSLKIGEGKKIPVHIKRNNFSKSIRVWVTDQPPHVKIVLDPGTGSPVSGPIETTGDSVDLQITAEPLAIHENYRVAIHADAGEQHPEVAFTLRVVYWREDFQLPDNAEDDIVTDHARNYCRQVVLKRGDSRIRFIVIPQGSTETKAFYMMEDKVSLQLFKEFARQHPSLIDEEWKNGGLANGKRLGKAAKPRHPAFAVHVEDAYNFARWLGGNLPTVEQYKNAAGFYDRGNWEGPFRSAWDQDKSQLQEKSQIAVDRPEEGPVEMELPGKSIRDQSRFGIRYLAGNGLEWTRNILGTDEVVPLPRKPNPVDRVILFGRSYCTDPKPLRFDDMKDVVGLGTEAYTAAKEDIGFRVVLEPR